MTDSESEFEQLREVREMTAALPESIEPPRDLWPEISASIRTVVERDGAAGRASGRPTGHSGMRVMLTAASLAILLLVPASRLLIGTDPVSQSPEVDFVVQRMVVALDAETRPSADEMRAWASVGEELAETWMLLQTEMEAINLAIAETRQAWLVDPDNTHLAMALSRVCRVRTELQKKTTELVARI